MEGLSLLMLEAKVSVDGNLFFQPWKLIFPSTETLLSNVGNLPFQPREFFWKPYTTGSLVGRSGVLSNESKKGDHVVVASLSLLLEYFSGDNVDVFGGSVAIVRRDVLDLINGLDAFEDFSKYSVFGV